jgi:hypothetical protein
MLRPLLSLFSCDRICDRVIALGPTPPKEVGLPTPNRLCWFLAFFVRIDDSGASVPRNPISVTEALTCMARCPKVSHVAFGAVDEDVRVEPLLLERRAGTDRCSAGAFTIAGIEFNLSETVN